MKTIRIIPRLDIKGPNLVKGIHLEGLRVMGKPEDFANQYYLDGADELIYMDVVASLYGRNSLLDIIQRTAENIFIPLTAGGGIRTLDDIRAILRAGADKVSINTAAINNPRLISEAARTFGSQCIVISIEAKRKNDEKYEAYTDGGREVTGIDVFDWARKVYTLGAGEILLTSIDMDGTRKGFDKYLIRKVAESVPIPVIACGGAGSPEDVYGAIKDGRADAISAGTIFHYKRVQDFFKADKFEEEGNIEYLKNNASINVHNIGGESTFAISDVKDHLFKKGIPVRISKSSKKMCRI